MTGMYLRCGPCSGACNVGDPCPVRTEHGAGHIGVNRSGLAIDRHERLARNVNSRVCDGGSVRPAGGQIDPCITLGSRHAIADGSPSAAVGAGVEDRDSAATERGSVVLNELEGIRFRPVLAVDGESLLLTVMIDHSDMRQIVADQYLGRWTDGGDPPLLNTAVQWWASERVRRGETASEEDQFYQSDRKWLHSEPPLGL